MAVPEDSPPSNASRVLQLLVLTGVRSNEARGALWAEIDFPSATWTIPTLRMKEGKEHRVPLSAAALDVLRGGEGRARRGGSGPTS